MSAYSFVKLFSSITESTVWFEPAGTRLVWITLLAKSDRFGRFSGSIPGLARLANVTAEETERAIETFLAPDTHSRTHDYEGRRIQVIDGGWRILNYEKYREMRDTEVRREQNRQAKQRQRSKQGSGQPGVSRMSATLLTVSNETAMSAHAYADADSEKEKAIGQRGALTKLKEFWSIYPKRVKRKLALEIWDAKGMDARADMVIADVRNRFANDGRWLDGFIPDPTNYLDQERWDDELQPRKPAGGAGAPGAPVEPRRMSGPDETRALLDSVKPKQVASPETVREAVRKMRNEVSA